MLDWFIFGCIGKVGMYLLMQFPIHPKGEFFDKLLSCDLCLGVWVYTFLAAVFRMNILEGHFIYLPGVSELITGSIISLIAHLISLGWNEKFSIIVME